MIDRVARREARSRHPSAAGWRPDSGRFTEHMTIVFAREGRRHPKVAAGVQSARAATGETKEQFSARLGLASPWLERLESGDIGAEAVPPAVEAATPWVDWPALRLVDPTG